MMGGPITTASSGFGLRSQHSLRGSVTRPLRPAVPSSVTMISSSAAERISSSITSSCLLRAPMITVTLLPAFLKAWAIGNIGATPMPPPTQTTQPTFLMSVGRPSGPTTVGSESPTFMRESLRVVSPTT